jgi:hypothetical protein
LLTVSVEPPLAMIAPPSYSSTKEHAASIKRRVAVQGPSIAMGSILPLRHP